MIEKSVSAESMCSESLEQTVQRNKNAEDVARFLGVDSETVRRMAIAGWIPGLPVRTGKRICWRFSIEEVNACLLQRQQEISGGSSFLTAPDTDRHNSSHMLT